jgi:hypothetical protein
LGLQANGRRGAIGIEIELALLDPVLHVAAGAVHFFIKIAGLARGPGEPGHDEGWVGLALRRLRFGHDPPRLAPRGLARPSARLLGRCQLILDLGNQPIVLRQILKPTNAEGRHLRDAIVVDAQDKLLPLDHWAAEMGEQLIVPGDFALAASSQYRHQPV